MYDRARWPVAAMSAAWACLPQGAGAQQDVETLTVACVELAPQTVCREWVLAVQAVQGATGLLAAGGAQVPGGASTLGRRFGGMPRFAWSLRANALRANLPTPGSTAESTPWEGESFTGIGVHGSLAVGVFDGFSILPTVGGLFSLDVLGALGGAVLPKGDGFQNDPRYAGVGLRLGLLRESFTLPGVTMSASRRWLGEVELLAEPGIEATVDPTISSLRLAVGKDLLSLGILIGAGWDRYESSGEFTYASPCPGSCPRVSFQDFESDRLLFFGGASLNYLLLQLSAEGGWAEGFDGPTGRTGGATIRVTERCSFRSLSA